MAYSVTGRTEHPAFLRTLAASCSRVHKRQTRVGSTHVALRTVRQKSRSAVENIRRSTFSRGTRVYRSCDRPTPEQNATFLHLFFTFLFYTLSFRPITMNRCPFFAKQLTCSFCSQLSIIDASTAYDVSSVINIVRRKRGSLETERNRETGCYDEQEIGKHENSARYIILPSKLCIGVSETKWHRYFTCDYFCREYEPEGTAASSGNRRCAKQFAKFLVSVEIRRYIARIEAQFVEDRVIFVNPMGRVEQKGKSITKRESWEMSKLFLYSLLEKQRKVINTVFQIHLRIHHYLYRHVV